MNIAMYALSRFLELKYGQVFDAIKLTGKYAVGHKMIHTKKFKNAVSVFYPVSKHVADDKNN